MIEGLDWILLGIFGAVLDGAMAYAVYKWQAWAIDRQMKKMHPTERNGLNLDLSYRIDGSEVMGFHGRGVDIGDLIDNIMRGFNSWSRKKDDKVNFNVNKEGNNQKIS
jgi:hypothetical protein